MEREFQKFWGDWEKQGTKLGKEFIKKVGVKKLEQLGASTLPISKEWKGTNKTPKTDLIDGNKRISLKKNLVVHNYYLLVKWNVISSGRNTCNENVFY